MKKYYLICIGLLLGLTVHAQYWQSLNPGAGGRVQGVSCDPTTAGRMFVASDMEGFYYSSDYGTSWTWSGRDLPTAFILYAEGRGDKFFVGHAKGLSVSTDRGLTYTTVSETHDKTIGVIEVDPKNSNYVYAGLNWRGNDGHLNHYPQETTDTKQLFYSHDGGVNWTATSWNGFASGDPQVRSITADPGSNSNDVLISTSEGLYRSTDRGQNWTKVPGPAGIDNESCWGADMTVDGNWLYALYRKGGMTNLFVKNYPSGGWQDLGNAGWDSHNMWQPKVFQEPGNNHFVLIGQRDQNPNEGLFEGRFTVNGSTVSGAYEVILNHDGTSASVTYDFGWNYYVANCRNNTYYPAEWTGHGHERGVFTQAQQSYFTGDAADGNTNWRVVSTGFVKEQNGLDFYRSRGTSSTFTYDVAKYQNYVIQGQADNLALESWDNGGSWVQSRTSYGVQDGHAVHVIPHSSPIVLMDAASGFGGGNPAANSNLLYKNLDVNAPDHNWQRLAFGTDSLDKKGLPRNRIWQFHADPNDYKRLYVITHTGLYLCDDIVSLINNGAPFFRRIHSSTSLGASFSINENNTNEIFYKDNTGTYMGTRDGSGEYSWMQYTRSTGQTNNLHWGGVAVVNAGGNKYVYTYERYKGIVRADNGSTQFGASAVLWDADLFNYLNQPVWYDANHTIGTNGMYADGNTLYVPYQMWEDVRWGYGVMKGTVNNDGSVNWENWTEDLHYSVTKQIKLYDGKVYLATQGAGLLARKVNGSTADALPPIDETAWEHPSDSWYFIFSDVSSTAGLSWGNFGNVENSPSSAQASEGSSSRYVQGLDQSVAPGADHSLVISFDAIDASGGTLNLGLYGIGGSLSNLNVKLLDSNGGSSDNIGSSAPANSWGNNSVAISGGSLDPSQLSQIVIERWGGGESKMYVDNIYIEGANVVSNPPGNIPVTGVSLTPSTGDIKVGESLQLSASVSPSNASNSSVSYHSSSTSVATVSASGLVTAVSIGSTTITITTADGGFTDQATITVSPLGNGDCSATSPGGKPHPPCEVWVEATSSTSAMLHWTDNSSNESYFDIQRKLGTESWKAAGMPDGAANTNSVALTDLENGGTYKFRVKAFATGLGGSVWVETDEITLGGSSSVSVTGVVLSLSNLTLEEGTTGQLSATVSPGNASNQGVVFSTSNSNVATVSASGVVTAMSAGTAVITVTTNDGGFTDQTTITVTAANPPPNGNGDCSATSSAGKPNPPCEVWAEVTSTSSVTLHWNDNSDNEDFFDIMAQESGDTWRASGMPDGAQNTTSVSITGLSVGSAYKFRIKSKNSAGASVWVETDQVDLSTGSRIGTRTELPLSAPRFHVYPNPVVGIMNLDASSAENATIVTMSGQLLMTLFVKEGTNTFDLRHLEKGLYLIKIGNNVVRFAKVN